MLPCSARFPVGFPTTKAKPAFVPCSERHSYLLKDLSCVSDYNPRLIARVVDKEMEKHTTYRNLEPPFLKMESSHPVIYAPKVDGTRAELAFGRWALPKLKKELHHPDILVVMRALNSINDMMHNPERAFEASQIGLVDRLTDIMLHERDFVREKVCMILHTLAAVEIGVRMTIKRYKILSNLAILIEDEVDGVRYKAQTALERITLWPIGLCSINCADYMLLLLRLVGGTPNTENQYTVALHLATLSRLLRGDVKALALRHNALDIIMAKVDHPLEAVRLRALECIAILCRDPLGRSMAAEKNFGFKLCKKLFDPSMEVKVKVAAALAFATIQSDTRRKMSKRCTVEKLTEILEYMQNSEGQLMAAKVLTNLAEDPVGRVLVKKMKGRIHKAFASNKDVERHKRILMNALKKKN